MSSYVQGFADRSITNYCPNCGERVGGWHSSGGYEFDVGECYECGMHFAVIEMESTERELEAPDE